MNFIVAVHDYVWNSFVMLLQGVLSSAPDIISNTLHGHHDHGSGDHHHGIDLEHPVLCLEHDNFGNICQRRVSRSFAYHDNVIELISI